MHRVELKGRLWLHLQGYQEVPNAPCGVESGQEADATNPCWEVPNAPCGVES